MSLILSIRENRGIVEISFDDRDVLKIQKKHFSARPVEAGEDVVVADYADRIAAVQANECSEAALTRLDYSEKSAMELKKALLQKGFVLQAVESTVARLQQNGLVDDRRYANRIAENSLHRPVGMYQMKRKLAQKGFSEDDVEDAMAGFDEEPQRAAALALAKKIWRKYEKLDAREARQKLVAALARRGFSWDAAGYAAGEIFESDEWE